MSYMVLLLIACACVSCPSAQSSFSLQEADCLSRLEENKQTIQLTDSGDGFTEMVPPKPFSRYIWPGEKTTLYYYHHDKEKDNKVWLFTSNNGNSYRLNDETDCFELKESIVYNPHIHTFSLLTSIAGIYMFSSYYTDWKIIKNVKDRMGKLEVYKPLMTFAVLGLKPAGIGLLLRFASYESLRTCTGAQDRVRWVMRSLKTLYSTTSQRRDDALTDGHIEFDILRQICRRLPNDTSPNYVATYYNIDRARILPNGFPLDQERPWAVRGERLENLHSSSQIVISVPQPFGSVTRIRLTDVYVNYKTDELIISLITRSLEGMNEPFWGVKPKIPPFPPEQVEPYVFASVRINSTLFRLMGAEETGCHLRWMLIEPAYGRIRTANGVLVAMNVWDSWINGQFLVEVHLDKIGVGHKEILVGTVIFEQPQDPEDVGEALRVSHNERPLPGATPKFGRACLTTKHGYSTSSYYLSLENRSECIRKDKEIYGVWKSTKSVRSSLIPYTIQLLYDDFGDELVNATGTLVGQIQVATYTRKVSRFHGNHSELDCLPFEPEDGETFRIGFLIDRKNDSLQYLARWKDRWVRFKSHTAELRHYNLSPVKVDPWISIPNQCPPERTKLDFVYDLETRTLRAMANDTDVVLLNVTLPKHPIWMGFEVFADNSSANCDQCFVHVQIDRRGVQYPRPIKWPVVDSAVNEWHQIHFPQQRNAKAQWNGWVEVTQIFQERVALSPSPTNLQRRLLELIRRLANPIDLSVAMVGAGSVCLPGQYMSHGIPAACAQCQPGSYAHKLYPNTSFPVNVCSKCPKGSYQPSPGMETCIICPKGQSTMKTGSWSRGACGPNMTLYAMHNPVRVTPPNQFHPVAFELLTSSLKRFHYWVTNRDDPEVDEEEEDIKSSSFEAPSELRRIRTSQMIFNMVGLVFLLTCVMVVVTVSIGVMISITIRMTRYRHVTGVHSIAESTYTSESESSMSSAHMVKDSTAPPPPPPSPRRRRSSVKFSGRRLSLGRF